MNNKKISTPLNQEVQDRKYLASKVLPAIDRL